MLIVNRSNEFWFMYCNKLILQREIIYIYFEDGTYLEHTTQRTKSGIYLCLT